MVLIFGWGNGKAEDRGEVVAARCPNCHNDVFLHEIRSKKQISLYFVPVVPYGTDEYLVCPICGRGLQVRPEQRATIDGMKAATRAMRRGRLAEPVYRTRIDAFWRSMGVTMADGMLPPRGPADAARGQTSGAGATSQVSPPVAPPAAEASLADRLTDLARLHARGILTDDEFAAAKRRVLER